MEEMNAGKPPIPESSPNLKAAADKIKAIMDEHDIAGVVILHEPTHTEFFMKVNPSYSCAFMQGRTFQVNDPDDMLPKEEQVAKPGDDGTIEFHHPQRKELIANTLNMLVNLAIVTQNVSIAFSQSRNFMVSKLKIHIPAPPRIIDPRKNGKHNRKN